MINKIIEMCLRDYPKTRDSDKALLIHVWEHCGLYLSEVQRDKFFQITSPETIRRTRQKIQESGKYPASKRVGDSRRIKGLVIQQNAPIASPKRMTQLFNVDDYRIRRNPL